MISSNERRILEAWQVNAEPWIEAVNASGIRAPESPACHSLLRVIKDYGTDNCAVLDVGCGEGWLTHTLAETGYRATGVDATRALVAHAARKHSGNFLVGDFSRLTTNIELGEFELVICNFSLFGEQSVKAFFYSLPGLLKKGGYCIVQTLHPLAFFDNGQYRSHWTSGTWAGLSATFADAPPWFFRTLADWSLLFRETGMTLVDIREPAAEDECPKSIIFVVSTLESDTNVQRLSE